MTPDVPHPLPDRESLEREVLGVLEHEVADVEYRPEPDDGGSERWMSTQPEAKTVRTSYTCV